MLCSNCGTENRPGSKFCSDCGSQLARVCPSCGTPASGRAKFCDECGTALAADAPAPKSAAGVQRPLIEEQPRAAERRLVSVLFADLVGFTTLSESRDPEEVREILSRYFDTCRELIGRYGGVVEKFIGDAVMAVWGTPVANEDDAERAVRAALDLTQAVATLGQEVGSPALRARAGVLTGEAAVSIGAEGQGMVAGDLVNTASRIQAAAQPGQVFVGESTRRATEAAIAYEDEGTHHLKGKAEPVPLWRALRVTAGRGGALKSGGLEAPFVGRERELRLVKELFHASAEERRAQLVSLVGIAGIGKSRLSWEFFKYIDGLAEVVHWHRGRCLSYGEGVTYWALAEMVRMRAGILEGEETASALDKLRASLQQHIPDGDERRWIEPRLAHLLGLEERTAADRQDLFSAWRLFFERLSDARPTILVFEDMQWAEASLLDFVEYLLEWSRSHSLYLLVLARPELVEAHPNWGAGKRNFTSLYLEPLSSEAMDALLSGLVPGLPGELRSKILDRAEGVPLYAVETVRMLLDRGLLVREGTVYRPAGPVEALEVPETLHALIAARLDGLTQDERRLLQDASVLGKSFTRQGLVALTGFGDDKIDSLLSSLLRKEMLVVQADPRSPDRGQYGFVQDLVKRVAYETLPRRERKSRHLAVAAYLERERGAEEEEIVEVVAAHYVDAYRLAPEAPDAEEIKEKAKQMLSRAGQRAASLAASEEAERYFEQAAELAGEPVERGELLERAGQMAWRAGKGESATAHFEAAMALFESEDQPHLAARVSARLGEVDWWSGRLEGAVERMEAAFEVLRNDEPDEDLAMLAAQLGRFQCFMGDPQTGAERIEQALDMAESLWLPEVLSQALNTKGGLILESYKGRPEEGVVLMKHALQVALDNEIPSAALRAYYNLSNVLYYRDRYDPAAEFARDGLALARRFGDATWQWALLSALAAVLVAGGRWDEALERVADIHLEESTTAFAAVEAMLTVPTIHIARGSLDEARGALAPFRPFADSADIQNRAAYAAALAAVLRSEGRIEESLARAREAFEARGVLGSNHPGVKLAFVEATEAAFALGDLASVEELVGTVERLDAGRTTPLLRAQATRFRARLATLRGDDGGVEGAFKSATGLLREIGTPFWLGVTLLEHGEWLAEQGRTANAEPLLVESGQIFEGLKAVAWLSRLARTQQVRAAS